MYRGNASCDFRDFGVGQFATTSRKRVQWWKCSKKTADRCLWHTQVGGMNATMNCTPRDVYTIQFVLGYALRVALLPGTTTF